MILTDKHIKDRIRKNELIIEGYIDQNLHSISYDLTIDKIITDEKGTLSSSYTLRHNEFVFIKTKEKLRISNDIIGKITERNSIMRLGLYVSAPTYQPGHTTYAYLRVVNLAHSDIEIKQEMGIAQIMFEQLLDVPFSSYGENDMDIFQDEMEYIGIGAYKSQYDDYIKKASDVKQDLESTENKIYTNILTFMGIFVSIFSLIIFNFGTLASGTFPAKDIIAINSLLGTVIAIFMGLILLVINAKKYKHVKWLYFIFLALFISASVFYLINYIK